MEYLPDLEVGDIVRVLFIRLSRDDFELVSSLIVNNVSGQPYHMLSDLLVDSSYDMPRRTQGDDPTVSQWMTAEPSSRKTQKVLTKGPVTLMFSDNSVPWLCVEAKASLDGDRDDDDGSCCGSKECGR